MPDIGRQRENYGNGVRSIAEGAYIIIYRVKDKRLETLRVLHGARDPERVIEDEPIKDCLYGLHNRPSGSLKQDISQLKSSSQLIPPLHLTT